MFDATARETSNRALGTTFGRLVDLLACPRCKGRLQHPATDEVRCPACGRGWPIVDGDIPWFVSDALESFPALSAEMRAQEHAADFYEDGRTWSYHWDRVSTRALLDMGARDVPGLDLGCGPGKLATLLGSPRGIIGVDVASALLRRARTREQGVVGAAGEMLPFANGAFATVYARSILHHSADATAVLGEVHRVLRPGGGVFFADPRAFAVLEHLKSLVRRNDPAYAPTHRAFSRPHYRRMIESAGFEIVRFRDTDPVALPGIVLADLLRLGRLGGARTATHVALRAERLVAHVMRRLPGLSTAGFTFSVLARKPMHRDDMKTSRRKGEGHRD